MFSSSVAGAGSICLGCQLRAVSRRGLAARSSPAAQGRFWPQQFRHASDSSEASSSADDFFESVLNSQRHGDEHDAAKGKSKKKTKPKPYRTRSSEQDDDDEPFVRTYTDRSLLEGAYTQPEVTFEDVWEQDSDLHRRGDNEHRGRQRLAAVEENPDEISYGFTTHTEQPRMENFNWLEDQAELREKYADRKVSSRKVEAPMSHRSADREYDFADTEYEISDREIAPPDAKHQSNREYQPVKKDYDDKRSERYNARPNVQRYDTRQRDFERRPTEPMHQATDNLFNWGEESTTAARRGNHDVGVSFDSARLRTPQEPVKNYFRKGVMRLVEDISPLPVETLGQDAPVIVLKEDGKWKQEQRLKWDNSTPEPTLKIEDSVEQNEGLGLDTILENIDELRPAHRILPAREFKVVFDKLMKGFTAFQLESYVERDRKHLEEGDERPFLGVVPDEIAPLPWIVSQGRWVPEVNGAVEDVDHPLKGYILKTMPPKQRLVMQLMRECWNMSVQELLDGHGILDIEVRDREFRLLTLGSQLFLTRISRAHLTTGGGKAIEIVKSRRALRIVGPKAVAESCLKSLAETLQHIKTKSVNLTPGSIATLTPEVLEELGRITNSIVELNEARHELNVTWVDVADRAASELEDVSDVVLRLIFTSRPSTRIGNVSAVYPDPSEQGRLVDDMGNNKDKLPWSDRRAAWARLCLPVTVKTQQPNLASRWPLTEAMLKYRVEPATDDFIDRASSLQVAKSKTYEYMTLRYSATAGVPLGFPRPRRYTEKELMDDINQPTKPTFSGWLPFRTHTSAVFGHVLHRNHKDLAASITKGTDALAVSRRVIAPLIPPITEMDLPGWVPYIVPRNMTSMVIMRFTPSLNNTSSAESADPAPVLELRLAASDEDIISIDSLRAIAHTHVADICLPGEVVDARLTQRLVAELPGHALDHTPGMEPLVKFLRDSTLDPARGRLVTPPALDGLGLPSWLFYTPETDIDSPFLRPPVLAELYDAAKAAASSASSAAPTDAPKKKSKKPKKRTGKAAAAHTPHPAHSPYASAANVLAPTSYLFAGLEIHRPLETAYDGWRLIYTSIEAGAGGGRRAELSLAAQPAFDKTLRRPAAAISAGTWLRSMYNLARGRVLAPPKEKRLERPGDVDEERTRSVVRWLGDKR